MRSNRPVILIVLALAVVLAMTACGSSGPSAEEVARQEQWAALQEAKVALDAKRAELAEANLAMIAAAEVAEDAEDAPADEAGEEGAEEVEVVDLAAAYEALSAEVVELSEDFGNSLIGFLNADPIIEGEPLTDVQVAALRMKSDEDIVLAQEWIEKGGDYKRALDIYNAALMLDPENEKLEAAIAEAGALRFMSEERLAAVEKGMTEEEVRALLGTPITYNIKEYEERGATAWFYPTADDGAASAVWFKADKSDTKKVYQVKFDQVKSPTAEAEEAE